MTERWAWLKPGQSGDAIYRPLLTDYVTIKKTIRREAFLNWSINIAETFEL